MNKQLELHSLSKKYKKANHYANENINLTFNQGEISAITGHNGAGKTTMLNQIIGITKPTKGSITFDGVSFATDSKMAREYVSMMPQLHAPLDGVTMAQSVESILKIRGLNQKEAKKECNKILEELKIDEWKDTPGQKLSGGLRRLTSFAMAVAFPSPIIVLDEPTNDVDPIRRQIIWKHLKKLSNDGHIIIVVTHNILEVEKYADRYILMNRGKVLEDKNLKEQSIEISERNHMVVNFINLNDLKDVIIPNAIKTNMDNEELVIAMELTNDQVSDAINWVMNLIRERKVQNYKISPKSLNETYGEMIDGDDENSRK
ncbi:ABC transporter ATP-binding protein [Vagococcus carniphilus]|uniref:ABC transporter ATP-binding protein n=1 Tax=Vagococcus carniphilus TaxID=218144 RepID=A0A430B678_9ENTE|nr:ABC transporter ATP-binding protein [Vagococcus carniphilus]QNN72700.1 ABC transporter ATP-binding protein [Vagococcus carniphilus]RSU15806.1 ABC transporter ATP-binding protein [Vagococcus carniphilus]